jgi:hypothetical protein
MRRELEQFGSWALAWLCLRYVLGAAALLVGAWVFAVFGCLSNLSTARPARNPAWRIVQCLMTTCILSFRESSTTC